MVKRFTTLCIAFLCCIYSYSQNQVSGVVINGADNSKLPSASVFINNSSKGTLTANDGTFLITDVSLENFVLVVSYSGFETVSLNITPENLSTFHTIRLYPRKVELEEVSIEAPVKDGWEKWGKLFTENFIGTSAFAGDCRIENPEVLRFFYNKKTNIIRAISLGNLIIDNRALGYKVRYQLEQFTYDPKTKLIAYFGYTGFEDLDKNRRKKWEANRRKAYEGSVMHFIRALYRNTTGEEGFEVKEKIRIYNNDSVFAQIYRAGDIAKTVLFDSGRYLTQQSKTTSGNGIPDYIDLYSMKPFLLERATGIVEATKEKTFYFSNYLQVTYHARKASSNGLTEVVSVHHGGPPVISELYLVREELLIIYSDGLYFDPTNLLTCGYWATQKMAETLPSDYELKN